MDLLTTPLLMLLAQAAPSPKAEAPPKVAAPAGPVVVLETSLGTVKMRLLKDKAPISVDNFLKYVKSGHYNGTIFHRVIPGFMAQGGGFTPDMGQRPTQPPIKNEASNGVSNRRGTVAMARTSNPDSATSQFFINVVDNGYRLDRGAAGDGYAVFAEVIEGMDVVDKMVAVPRGSRGPHGDVPKEPIVITKARTEP